MRDDYEVMKVQVSSSHKSWGNYKAETPAWDKTQRTWCKRAAQVVTQHVCQRCVCVCVFVVCTFWVIFHHISLLNLHPHTLLSLSTLSPPPPFMASGCLWFIYFNLMANASVRHLCSVAKAQTAALRAQICAGHLEGAYLLCRTCQGIYSCSQHQVTDANNVEILCVFVPAGASFSSSCWLLLMLLSLSDSSPSVLGCKQGGKQALRELVEPELQHLRGIWSYFTLT